MNSSRPYRDGVQARRGDGEAPAANSEDASSDDASQDPQAHEQPPVVGNGVPIKAKPESGLSA